MFSNKESIKAKEKVKFLLNLLDFMEKYLGLIRSEKGKKK